MYIQNVPIYHMDKRGLDIITKLVHKSCNQNAGPRVGFDVTVKRMG